MAPLDVMGDRDVTMHYLRRARRDVARALDGVDEYDARRPLTPSGSNLLGLVKHLASVEHEYVTTCAGFPTDRRLSWVEDGSMEENADLWLTEDESAAWVLDLYAVVAKQTERAAAALPPDSPAKVPWWAKSSTTFDTLLMHITSETAQHAGHLEIMRELLDGQGDRGDAQAADRDAAWWTAYRQGVFRAAQPFKGRGRTVRVPAELL